MKIAAQKLGLVMAYVMVKTKPGVVISLVMIMMVETATIVKTMVLYYVGMDPVQRLRQIVQKQIVAIFRIGIPVVYILFFMNIHVRKSKDLVMIVHMCKIVVCALGYVKMMDYLLVGIIPV